jgi:Xaa-Pro dipeptidase
LQPQVLLLAGETTGYRHDADRELVFRQKSNVYHLPGRTIPSSYLWLAYQPGSSLSQTPSVELIIPKADLVDIMWSVPPTSLKEASETHDVTCVAHPGALPAAIDALITTLPGALFHTLPRGSPLFPVLSDEYSICPRT